VKKLSKILLVSVLGVILLAGTAMSYTYTYTDDYANWPGHYIDSRDQIGTPSVGDMTITINDTLGYLESIAVEVSERRVWDSLFINIDSACVVNNAYEGWDFYYIWNDSQDSGYNVPTAPATGFYSVGSSYNYITSNNGRIGHPSGISDGLASVVGYGVSVDYSNNLLTYTFGGNDKIYLGDEGTFTIGYSPWCANDVFLTPVPEPLTILLLGFGLLGLGLARRKS